MISTARGVRLPGELEEAIQREADRLGKSWSALTKELLTESMRMRQSPGIVFADGPAGRRAVVAGSGIDVWEVVAAWQEAGEDFSLLKADFPWLSELQLRAALSYYERFRDEIEGRLERERRWTSETVGRELPFSRKSHR